MFLFEYISCHRKLLLYILQPRDPKFYQDEGIEDGQEVAIQGKIVKNEYLTVGVIK